MSQNMLHRTGTTRRMPGRWNWLLTGVACVALATTLTPVAVAPAFADAASATSLSAKEYQDWLAGIIAPTPKTSPPLHSDAEWNALRDSYPFDYKLINRNGIPTPTLNGRFLMGVEYRYAPNTLEQVNYDTRVLAAAGINTMRAAMRSFPDEGGDPASIASWAKKEENLRQRGMVALLEPGGQHYMDDIVGDLYQNVLKKPMPEAFTRWHAAMPEVNKRYGDFFNTDYRRAHGEVLSQLLKAVGPAAKAGFIYSDEPEFHTVGPATAAAAADWRAFLQRFYLDATPARDSNKDGATFNAVFQKKYATWNDVEQFGKQEYSRDQRVKSLVDVRMRWGHARFINTLSAQCQTVFHESTVSEAYVNTMGNHVSLLNAMPHNRYVGFGNYSDIATTAQFAAATHAYNKPGYTFHINTPKGNYHTVRQIGVGSLPFTAAQLWWHLATGTGDAQDADYGRSYSLANWWEVNDGQPKSWAERINRIVEFDSRFLIIPQLAPFLGRFDSMPQEISNGVLWLEPPSKDLVRNTHVATEEALVLGEQKLDIDRYKLVIFLKRGPANFRETHAVLRDYVRRGGTVLVNLNEVGAGTTLFGQRNASTWLSPYRVGRGALDMPQVIYEDHFIDTAQWQQERFSHEGPSPLASPSNHGVIGAFPHGSQVSFVYKFRIPEKFEAFRIADTHYVWARGDEVQMFISSDNKNWKLQHNDPARETAPYEWSKLFSVAGDLEGRRDLYVKYSFKAGDPNRGVTDNRGAALKEFRLEGLEAAAARSFVAASNSRTTVQLGQHRHGFAGVEPYLQLSPGMQGVGRVADGAGSSRPLLIIRPEGRGRWLVWNSPHSVLTGTHDSATYDENTWAGQWQLLNAAVQEYSGANIENYDEPYILQGEDSLMALRWEYSAAAAEQKITFKTRHPRVVVHEVLDSVNEGGAYIEAANGSGQFTTDLSQAHLWVVKPYGRPILLAADGTVKHVVKIDDGRYVGNSLTTEMAEKATTSSPSAPRAAIHNGRVAEVRYDDQTKTARITGTGRLGPCVI